MYAPASLGAVNRCLQSTFTLLRMGKYVFNHHDRVVYYHPAANPNAAKLIFSDRPNRR